MDDSPGGVDVEHTDFSEGLDMGSIPSATHWPSLAPEDVEREWGRLATWVVALQHRFPHLDHHVIPTCWWQHNELVEALAALRDHEAVSFSKIAPATAPVDWMRALRDVGALMRTWTAEAGCGSTHQVPMPLPLKSHAGWGDHVAQDVERRRRGAEDSAGLAASSLRG